MGQEVVRDGVLIFECAPGDPGPTVSNRTSRRCKVLSLLSHSVYRRLFRRQAGRQADRAVRAGMPCAGLCSPPRLTVRHARACQAHTAAWFRRSDERSQ